MYNTSIKTFALTNNGSVAGFVISYSCEKQRFNSWFEQFFGAVTVSAVETSKRSTTKQIKNKVRDDITFASFTQLVYLTLSLQLR